MLNKYKWKSDISYNIFIILSSGYSYTNLGLDKYLFTQVSSLFVKFATKYQIHPIICTENNTWKNVIIKLEIPELKLNKSENSISDDKNLKTLKILVIFINLYNLPSLPILINYILL